jgi:hypothetical protein
MATLKLPRATHSMLRPPSTAVCAILDRLDQLAPAEPACHRVAPASDRGRASYVWAATLCCPAQSGGGRRRDRVLAIPRTPLRKPPSALGFEIFDRGPSSIRDFFVLNGLPLLQSSQAGLFESRYVNENVSSASLRLDEAKSFFQIERLHRAARHFMVSRG